MRSTLGGIAAVTDRIDVGVDVTPPIVRMRPAVYARAAATAAAITDPDPQVHIDGIEAAVDAGYDHVYTHRISDDQETLVDLYPEEVLPSFS